MAQPKLLLLDEPCSAQPGHREVLVDAVKEINRELASASSCEQYARPIFPIITYGYVWKNEEWS